MRLIIAGTRTFNDWELLKRSVDYNLMNTNEAIEIVSGSASGADKLGEKYAFTRGLPCIKFPAQWNEFGKQAGFIRNQKMAKYATHCIVFWDGRSIGTQIMIRLAKENNLPTKIINYSIKSPSL